MYGGKEEEEGFTLLELLLVLSLLGIIAGIAIPSMWGVLDEITLDEATQEVVNALEYARTLAIQDNTTRLVDFAPSAETCTLLLGYKSNAINSLTFDNMWNPPSVDRWGVSNVAVTDGSTVLLANNNAYGNIQGGDTTHIDKMEYTFTGYGEHLLLTYNLYDADGADEIAIYLNGVKVADAGDGLNSMWSKTKTIRLPNIINGENYIINPLDKRKYVINFKKSARFTGVDISSTVFGSVDDVIFYPDGTPSSGGVIVLSYKGRTKNISVESGTGSISVQ